MRYHGCAFNLIKKSYTASGAAFLFNASLCTPTPRSDLSTFRYSYLCIHAFRLSFKPVCLATPVTPQGISYRTILLYPTYSAIAATAFLPPVLIDSYIRTFVSGYEPHSYHRHFIDPRHICRTIHLWTAFHSGIPTLFGRLSADFSVLCRVREVYPSPFNAVSGGAFQGVTLSFHSSEYQLGKFSDFPVAFTSLQDYSHAKFICEQRVAPRPKNIDSV
jgi:hypothetical protein